MAQEIIREDIINHTEEDKYVVPEEAAVREKLEWFRDQKLAFMVHWGLYSQLGITESWPLSDGDAYWSRCDYTWAPNGEAFRKQYFDMSKTFNPIRFCADEWADFAKAAGFRYFIFTTKHHDGFCMFDSKYSDYKITSPDCPFSQNGKRDIARELFDAFRARGIAIAPYFSKPDWHCPWYWADGCEKPIAADRNPTYDPLARPDLWEKFTEFTQNQLCELAEDYGPVDILWLDGGQVNPQNHQDIRLGEVAARVRKTTPGLIFADRTVGGLYENYVTPECQIPERILDCPWESCIPIGGGFAYSYDDEFKTPSQLVKLLIQVVSRGGNLALNLGAQPDGRLPKHGMQSALKLGEWLNVYGEAIFGTRAAKVEGRGNAIAPGGFGFTRKGNTVYALLPLDGRGAPGREIDVPWIGKVKNVSLLPNGEKLAFTYTSAGLLVKLPTMFGLTSPLALVLKMETEE